MRSDSITQMITGKRRFHNYFAKHALRQALKKEEINFHELHKRVYVGDSSLNGVGIFSCDKIKKNEIIEICPTMKIKNEDIPEKLINYLFEGKQENMNTQIVEILIKKKDAVNYKLFPLGYGILYNHSDSPNASVHIIPMQEHRDEKNETIASNQIIMLRAQRDIQENEEIFISYGHSWWSVS
ncbi:SET domain containing protein [Plasmodium gonderi]|uniref:SET domain containing protein n=1 Tax=Plasmodium gonderi TaxID=77519 RepID=A0A1Y1JUE5_PLAGO|nr:SET domain containing protein [Plasmodium gonderi]GAW83524.1 SET domain containing protein [Plasmodium gonderi]